MPDIARLAVLSLFVVLSACSTVPSESERESDSSSTRTDRPASAQTAVQPPSPITDWQSIRREFIDALHATGMDATVEGDGSLKLTLTTDGVFASGSANIRPAFQATLDKLAATLHSHPLTSARIVGHTDSVGSEMANQELSAKRADAVMSHLIGRGIPFTRLIAEGKGESQPIADNGNEAGRARNRRVEIFIVPQSANNPGKQRR